MPKKRLKVKRLAKPPKKKSKMEQARDEFWKNLPESELNPNADKDFDSILGEMLKPVKQEQGVRFSKPRKPKANKYNVLKKKR